MAEFLFHLYSYAETYVVLLIWIVVPLSFVAIHFMMQGSLEQLFAASNEAEEEGVQDGAN